MEKPRVGSHDSDQTLMKSKEPPFKQAVCVAKSSSAAMSARPRRSCLRSAARPATPKRVTLLPVVEVREISPTNSRLKHELFYTGNDFQEFEDDANGVSRATKRPPPESGADDSTGSKRARPDDYGHAREDPLPEAADIPSWARHMYAPADRADLLADVNSERQSVAVAPEPPLRPSRRTRVASELEGLTVDQLKSRIQDVTRRRRERMRAGLRTMDPNLPYQSV